MNSRFLKDTGFNFLGHIVTLIFGIASSVVIARILGPEQRGILAVVVLLPMTVHALIASGFSATVTHSIASEAWEDSEIMPRLLGIWIYLTAIMLTVGVVALFFHEQLFGGTPFVLLVYSVALMPGMLLHACSGCILSGKRAFRYQMYSRFAGAPISFLLIMILVWWMDLGAFGVVTSALIGTCTSLTLNFYWAPRLIDTDQLIARPQLSLRVLKESLSFGLKSHIANLSAFLNYRADQFIVNAMLGSASVGIYTIAVNNSERLWMLVGSFSAVLFPTASAKQDDPARIARFTARLAAIMLFAMGCCGVVFMLIAEIVVVFLYGEEYRSASDVIVWLVPGIVCLGHSKILANYIAGRGRPEINAVRGTVALVVNVAANFVLIPIYGIIGAAVATTISYSLSAFAGYLAFLRIAKVSWHQPIIPSASDLAGIYRRLLQFRLRLTMSGTDR